MLEKARYLINELAKRADTTVRTIRYYTSEGLLPQPDTDSKYAYYDENHLRRLELILRMKEAYLPLKEIRQIMLSLSDEEVKKRLEEDKSNFLLDEDDMETPMFLEKPGKSDALDYISNLLETQSKYRTDNSPPKRPAQIQLNQEKMQIQIPFSPDDVENWQRIILSPGVEMHLRYPTDSDTNHRIQQLISFAKKIFLKQ
ncbi:MAG: MerR family transcriptional regulator [Anaerolineaceae bacterium]|nr:MerR family transcriptional regulator [Anaerolineaceae bacterium]